MSQFAAFFLLFAATVIASLADCSLAHSSTATSSSDAAAPFIAKAIERRLHEREEWRRLVHYRKRSFGLGWQSEADNKRFFLAENGKDDPRAELVETLKLGFTNQLLPPAREGAPSLTARCQFPARWSWLAQELAISDSLLPTNDCSPYFAFRDRVRPLSATLIFSGYYVNNPSSAFGHLLLRLNRSDRSKGASGSELLDNGVNYAAVNTVSNPVLYAIYGLTGVFEGSFSSIPYYYKVREYSDYESRDLWEYELDLTREELDRLVAHLWELGSTHFDYFYLTENCAYHLLAALEAAAPRTNLLDRIPFYVIPVDAVKAVTEEPGLVKRVDYRPSTQRILRERYSLLSKEEKARFLKIRDQAKPAEEVKDLPPESAARVLDTVLDHIDHKHFKELILKTNQSAIDQKQNVLVARSRLPAGGQVQIEVGEKDYPHKSHDSLRWYLGFGNQKIDTRDNETFLEGEVRFALHDIHDPLDGYLAYSTVEFFKVRARYYTKPSRGELTNYTLFTASNLAPFSNLNSSRAWRVQMAAHRVRDRRCENCLAAVTQGLMGYSWAPAQTLVVYGLLGGYGETSPDFRDAKWIASAAANLGFRWNVYGPLTLAGEVEGRRVFDRETFDRLNTMAKLRWNGSTTQAFELEYLQEVATQEAILRYIRYF